MLSTFHKRDSRIGLHAGITMAVMLFIFIQSAMPGEMSGAESNFMVRAIVWLTGADAEALGHIVRKAAHFTEFAVLGWCLAVNVRDGLASRGRQMSAAARLLFAWLPAVLYAGTDEIHQYFVPGRACAFTDVCIDAAGAAAGAVLAMLFMRRLAGRGENNNGSAEYAR